MSLTQQQLEHFHRDGYIIVPDVFDADVMDAALTEVDLITYGKSFDEVLEDVDKGILQSEKHGFTNEGSSGRTQFPTGVAALDTLFENENYLDIFEQLLGDKPSYCNAHLFVRSGPTDKRHSEHPWQGYHTDHDSNCFLPPSSNVGPFDYVNSGVYLHDVELDGAPMQVIPGSHHQLAGLIPRLIAEGNWQGRGGIDDIRKVPEFAKPVPSVAKKGSAMFYSSYLIHAAVPFENKRKQRSLWTMSCARRDTQSFVKFSNLYDHSSREFTNSLFTNTTPRVRSVFGWPEPGDDYYTEATLSLIGEWFPGIDTEPYRSAMK